MPARSSPPKQPVQACCLLFTVAPQHVFIEVMFLLRRTYAQEDAHACHDGDPPASRAKTHVGADQLP